jgi:putative addiction module killer protein
MIVKYYRDKNNDEPFISWLARIKDKITKVRIQQRLRRIELGNFGDHKSVGEGVWELRLSFGPGYRIYYGLQNDKVVILLCGGDKKTQKSDVKRAQEHWKEYMES